MDLQYYFSVVWRRKWVILFVLVPTLAIATVGQLNATPSYRASSTIRVALSLSMTQNSQLYTYNSQLLNTFVSLSTSRPVRAELMERLDARQLPEIEVAAIPNTELIRIITTSPDPELAALTSNTLAQVLIDQNMELFAGGSLPSSDILREQTETARQELEKVQSQYQELVLRTPVPPGSTPVPSALPPAAPDELTAINLLLQEKQRTYEAVLRRYEEAQYREALAGSMITIVEEALVPRAPSEPRVTVNLSIAAVAGLFAGLMVAFILENTDKRLHSIRAIEETAHIETLGILPRVSRRRLSIKENGSTPYAEAVRMLAARAQLWGQPSKQNVLILTGADFQQGTTTLTANLGIALNEQGRSVVIVDFNGRNPRLHTMFNLPMGQGLTDVVTGGLDMKEALQKTGDGEFFLLSFGSSNAGSYQTLNASGVTAAFKTLRQKFDFILVDAPSLAVADIMSIAPHADKIVLVARCHRVKGSAVRAASGFLSELKDNEAGLVVNEAKAV